MNCTHAEQETDAMLSLSRVSLPVDPQQELQDPLCSLTLPHCQPELYDALHSLVVAADPLMHDMEISLDQLKEMFLESVYNLFASSHIDRDARLVIGFDDAGNLTVIDHTHPQAADAERLLASTPSLADILRQIARDTLMLSSLNTLGQAFSLYEMRPPSPPDELLQTYQVCLKGELSHFYYS